MTAPLQLTYNSSLMEELIASSDILINPETPNQVGMFRNPLNGNAVEGLVITTGPGGDGQLMYLGQDSTTTTGWVLDALYDDTGAYVFADAVICCATPWGSVDAFYVNAGDGAFTHIWMTEPRTWSAATSTVPHAPANLTGLQISYSPFASSSNGAVSVAGVSDAQQAFVYVGTSAGRAWERWTGGAFTLLAQFPQQVSIVLCEYDSSTDIWSAMGVQPADLSHPGVGDGDNWFAIFPAGNSITTAAFEPYSGRPFSSSSICAAVAAGTFSVFIAKQTAPSLNTVSYSYVWPDVPQSENTVHLTVQWDGAPERVTAVVSLDCAINTYLIDTEQTLWVIPATTQNERVPLWTPPIALDSGIVQVYADPMPWDAPAVFAVDGDTGALHLHFQDPVTGYWTTGPVKLDRSEQYTINRWRTVASLYDANGNPVPNYPLTITAESACDIAIGNQYFLIDSQNSATVNTDSAGRATIATLATALTAPGLTLSAEGLPAQPVPQSPATPIHQYLGGTGSLPGMPDFDAATLLAATTPEGAPLAPGVQGGQPVLPAADAVSYIQQIAAMPTSDAAPRDGAPRGGSGRYVLVSKHDPARPVHKRFDTREELDAELVAICAYLGVTDSIWSDCWDWAGDIWRGIKNGVIEVVGFAIQEGTNIVNLIINGVGQLAGWVVQEINDALNAITAVFNLIETEIDNLIDWLKAIFNFDHIWDTKLAFASMLDQLPGYLSGQITTAKQTIATGSWFSAQTGAASSAFGTVAGAMAGNTLASQPVIPPTGQPPSSTPVPGQPPGSTVSAATISTDPKVTWMQDQVIANPASAPMPDTSVTAEWNALVTNLENAGQNFYNAMAALAGDLEVLLQQAGSDIDNIEFSSFLTAVNDNVVPQLLAFADQLILAALDLAQIAVDGLADLLTTNLPPSGLISLLYDWISGSGNDPQVADIIALIAAFPTTVLYSLINDGAEPFPGGTYSPRPFDDEEPPVGMMGGLLQACFLFVDCVADTATETPGSIYWMAVGLPLMITVCDWPNGDPFSDLSSMSAQAIGNWVIGFVYPVIDAATGLLTRGPTLARNAADDVGKYLLTIVGILQFLYAVCLWAVDDSENNASSVGSVITPFPALFQFLRSNFVKDSPFGPFAIPTKLVINALGDVGGGICEWYSALESINA